MKKILACFLFLLITNSIVAQIKKQESSIKHFGGAVTLTNKGISLLPTFTLGKPAAIFDMNVGGKRLSFEPQFRFSLEAKPWSFIFWWRYKLVNQQKFKLNVGAHPSYVFRTANTTINGNTNNQIIANRYVATEIFPYYLVAKNISIGMYYLYSHGFDVGGVNNTHFITLNSNFSNLKLSKKFYAKFNPQVYYLNQDGKDGFYATSTFTLGKYNFPITLQSILNKVIKTNITAGNNFIWNASVIYSFNKSYVAK